MIRHVTARNFRAFDELKLEFEPGTTFIVAPNGSGKTSLMLAVWWALLGEAADIDGKQSIRGDGPAEVTVEIDLSSEVTARITRRQPRRGPEQIEAVIADEEVKDADHLAALLTKYWHSDPKHLSRICFMEEHSVARRDVLTPGLDSHLRRIFGLDRLAEDLELAKREVNEAGKAIREEKQAARRPIAQRHEDEGLLTTLRQQLRELEGQRTAVGKRLSELRRQIELLDRWDRYREDQETRRSQLEAIVQQAGETLGDPFYDIDVDRQAPDLATVRARLTELEEEQQEELTARAHRLGALQGRLQAAAEALAQLNDAEADCPVCLRPLGEHDRGRAAEGHLANQQRLQEEIDELQSNTSTQARLKTLRDIRQRLDGIPPAVPPAEPPTLNREAASAEQEAVDGEFETLTRQVLEISQRIEHVESRLEDDAAIEEASAALRQSARRAVLAEVTMATFETAIAAIEREKVDPLRRAIESRWKQLMRGVSTLSWQPGEVKLIHGDHEVDYRNFSGGERTIATILTQLLVILATTEAKFLWLDEPLEHLDPDHRRMVASALMKATGEGSLRQIVVSTYEEPLVRRLKATRPDLTHVRYLPSLAQSGHQQ